MSKHTYHKGDLVISTIDIPWYNLKEGMIFEITQNHDLLLRAKHSGRVYSLYFHEVKPIFTI